MSDRRTTTTAPPNDFAVHEAAVRMQEQFVQTGAYKAADVTRVLGDVRLSVSGTVPPTHDVTPRKTANWTVPGASALTVKVGS